MISMKKLAQILYEELQTDGVEEVDLEWIEALAGGMDTNDESLEDSAEEIDVLGEVLQRVVDRLNDEV